MEHGSHCASAQSTHQACISAVLHLWHGPSRASGTRRCFRRSSLEMKKKLMMMMMMMMTMMTEDDELR
jgi:hypothetical protein